MSSVILGSLAWEPWVEVGHDRMMEGMCAVNSEDAREKPDFLAPVGHRAERPTIRPDRSPYNKHFPSFFHFYFFAFFPFHFSVLFSFLFFCFCSCFIIKTNKKVFYETRELFFRNMWAFFFFKKNIFLFPFFLSFYYFLSFSFHCFVFLLFSAYFRFFFSCFVAVIFYFIHQFYVSTFLE